MAEEKFKEISEAYQVLSDDKKRQKYDNPSMGGFEGFSFADSRDLFSQFFKSGFFDDDFGDNFFKQDFFSDDSFF